MLVLTIAVFLLVNLVYSIFGRKQGLAQNIPATNSAVNLLIGIDKQHKQAALPALLVQIKSAKTKPQLPGVDINVEQVDFSALPIREQVLVLQKERLIMLNVCGGASLIGIFMPRGSAALLLCDEIGLYDWPLWNNLAHVRTFWFAEGLEQSTMPAFMHLLASAVTAVLQ